MAVEMTVVTKAPLGDLLCCCVYLQHASNLLPPSPLTLQPMSLMSHAEQFFTLPHRSEISALKPISDLKKLFAHALKRFKVNLLSSAAVNMDKV